MNSLLFAVLAIIDIVLRLYMWLVIAAVVMSWLIQFNAVNRSNQFVYMIANGLYRMTEPVFRRIRRYLPDLGGLDVTPILVILAIYFVRIWLGGIMFDIRQPF